MHDIWSIGADPRAGEAVEVHGHFADVGCVRCREQLFDQVGAHVAAVQHCGLHQTGECFHADLAACVSDLVGEECRANVLPFVGETDVQMVRVVFDAAHKQDGEFEDMFVDAKSDFERQVEKMRFSPV